MYVYVVHVSGNGSYTKSIKSDQENHKDRGPGSIKPPVMCKHLGKKKFRIVICYLSYHIFYEFTHVDGIQSCRPGGST